MDKMRMESIDMTEQNIEKIGALFPNCITETKDADGKPKKAINFDLLQQMLSGDVIEGDEAYEFTWVGKKAAIVEANKPIRKTLRPCKEESVNWESTENLYIEGDNLEVLKLLQDTCRKKGVTVVVITHNQAITAMADRIITVKNGTVTDMRKNEHIVPVEQIEW